MRKSESPGYRVKSVLQCKVDVEWGDAGRGETTFPRELRRIPPRSGAFSEIFVPQGRGFFFLSEVRGWGRAGKSHSGQRNQHKKIDSGEETTKCLSADKWLNTLWHIHTLGCYSAIKTY